MDPDWNNLWSKLPNELVAWDGLADTHLNDLAELQAATGQEIHGFRIEPEFEEPVLADYRLVPSSALIDAGLVIPGINHDYLGAAPDVGAFEYEPTLFSDGFETGDSTRWSATIGAID